MTTYRLSLPEGPSMNHYWRRRKGGGMMISDAGRAYKAHVELLCIAYRREQRIPEPRASTVWAWSFVWHAGRRSGDLDNRRKVLQDCLKGLFWVDDKQIIRDGAALAYDPTNPRMEVFVEQLEVPHPFSVPAKKKRRRAVAPTAPRARSTS